MNEKQKIELRDRLAKLATRERKDLIQRAARVRAQEQTRKGIKSKRPVEWFMLELLTQQDGPSGIVIGVDRTRCIVRIDGDDIACRTTDELAAGDEVRVSDDAVVEVLPRRTTLSRKETGGQRLICANVDVVVVVVSVVAPPLHPRLIDRYLAAIQQGGAEAAVCLNKCDLGVSSEDSSAIDVYRSIAPVFKTSTESDSGVEELRSFLGSRLSVLVGHSGVGKSSLLNSLLGNSIADTGSVSGDTGKGRHTTTRSTLHEQGGLRILDTPGIREFAVRFDDPFEVAEGFAEIARVSSACRYSDCLHLRGGDCAVLSAVRSGAIHAERYESYRKLLTESFPSVG